MTRLQTDPYPALDALEAEAIYVIREAFGQFKRCAILFSGGKDSITLAHLARRAFAPLPLPIPLLHVDTGHNFPETLEFRDAFASNLPAQLLIRTVQDSLDRGRAVEEHGPGATRNAIQSVTLLDAIAELRLDCAMGGARRDEEKARAKERFFSHRTASGAWNPKEQRPELWHHLNGSKSAQEHFRVFPLSNWTEMDVWRYLQRYQVELPSLYFSHPRHVFWRGETLYSMSPFLPLQPGEEPVTANVRFRTVGDATCTGAFRSDAQTVEAIIEELLTLRTSERAGRADDRRSDSAMEDRKRQGYF